MKGFIKKLLFIVSTIIILLGLAFYVYTEDYYQAKDEVREYLNKANVEVEDDVIIFNNNKANKRLIFYPGAKVEFRAYAPLMNELCDRGFECYLLKMPFNLAFFGINEAEKYLDENKDNYLMGHSLGGSMAAEYLSNNPANIDGLILLASYSASNIADLNIKVLSIYGSEDGVLNREKYNESKTNLPANFFEFVIDGGNHAGFGSYGKQKNDLEAKISGKEQIELTADEIFKRLK